MTLLEMASSGQWRLNLFLVLTGFISRNPSLNGCFIFSQSALPLAYWVGCWWGWQCVGADRRSNRVFSQAELLRRLGHPLRLGLPAVPWTSPAVPVLVGQLATQLDQTLSWRVLSIARQHEAVEPLTQLLQQQGGATFSATAPILCCQPFCVLSPATSQPVCCWWWSRAFNSARALEEARLLISQMSSVQAVGVVLIGVPLPEELSSSVVG